ncbi:hypothetical protein [Mycolicibacterium flavescens]|nr:hypothetical protein [Mycolicibacterium flavescens]
MGDGSGELAAAAQRAAGFVAFCEEIDENRRMGCENMARHRAEPTPKNPVRTAAAVIGGSGLIVLAAVGAAGAESPGSAPVARSDMTVGATSTQTTPPNAPAVGVAVPGRKGPAALPSEEQAAK